MSKILFIKILHISSAKTWRGGEQQAAYLLEELINKHVECVMLCVKHSQMEAFCLKQNIKHYTYQKIFSSNPLIALKIKQLCKKESIDLIHTHDSHAHTFAVMSAGIFSNKIPIIVSRRVDFPIHPTSLSLWKYNHATVAKIVCVSEMIAQITAPAIRDKNKLAVVHSGIDLARFPYEASGILRQEFSIKKTTKLIGNVAAIAPHKDYFTFVETIKILKAKGLDAKYFIIGKDDGEQAAIKQLINKYQLQKDIIFTGFRNDIPKILPELDVFLLTSKTEGLGTSLLDAFACKVPVAATAAGGIPEIVRHQKTGLLAPVGDTKLLAKNVVSLLSQRDNTILLLKAAFTTAQSFSKKNTALKTLAIYRTILGNTPNSIVN